MRAPLEIVVNSTHLLLTEIAARHNIDYRKVAKYRNRFNDDAQPTRETEHHYGDYESEILRYFKRRQALFRPDNYLSRLNMGEKNRSEMVDIMAAIAFCNQMPTDAFLMAVRLCDLL
ncbi:hypothetical protein niasHS_000074 [Heterodera schachtii]|uniref:Uncharacterized protein n=1 Tax=Heterodera schachtii TaxID=97005 RepID=A0ABD2KMU5_HETSC